MRRRRGVAPPGREGTDMTEVADGNQDGSAVPPLRVAVVGLGSMGSGMASSLVRTGFTVAGYDVAPAAIERLAASGGVGAPSPAAAAAGVDAVVSVVLNAAQT